METRELLVSDEPQEAALKARRTLERLGELTSVRPGISLEGKIPFGVQNATLRIQWRAEQESVGDAKISGRAAALGSLAGTTLLLEAESEASRPAALSALERFEEAYHHYNDPNFKPDRMGVLPWTIIGMVVTLFLLGFLLWRIPAVRQHLPSLPAPAGVPSTPTPEPTPEATPEADGGG